MGEEEKKQHAVVANVALWQMPFDYVHFASQHQKYSLVNKTTAIVTNSLSVLIIATIITASQSYKKKNMINGEIVSYMKSDRLTRSLCA